MGQRGDKPKMGRTGGA